MQFYLLYLIICGQIKTYYRTLCKVHDPRQMKHYNYRLTATSNKGSFIRCFIIKMKSWGPPDAFVFNVLFLNNILRTILGCFLSYRQLIKALYFAVEWSKHEKKFCFVIPLFTTLYAFFYMQYWRHLLDSHFHIYKFSYFRQTFNFKKNYLGQF